MDNISNNPIIVERIKKNTNFVLDDERELKKIKTKRWNWWWRWLLDMFISILILTIIMLGCVLYDSLNKVSELETTLMERNAIVRIFSWIRKYVVIFYSLSIS